MEHKYLDFPKISDPRGNLSFIEFPKQIPFEIRRVFWTYNVPGGETQGGHAYRKQEEVIIALSGSLDVVITNRDGRQKIIRLSRANEGLYLPPMTWRHIENFSTNSVSLHISSQVFSDEDYIRNIKDI
jgi:hypothetical protein